MAFKALAILWQHICQPPLFYPEFQPYSLDIQYFGFLLWNVEQQGDVVLLSDLNLSTESGAGVEGGDHLHSALGDKCIHTHDGGKFYCGTEIQRDITKWRNSDIMNKDV